MGWRWNQAKNEQLKAERGLSFEDVVTAYEEGNILDDFEHPNREAYPNQRILVVAIRGYACLVPYVFEDEHIFLKTIFPSRKAQKAYRGR